MQDMARKFAHISRWEQANRNARTDALVHKIHESLAIKQETKDKRIDTKRKREELAEQDDSVINRKIRKLPNEQRQKNRKDTLEGFVAPTKKLPTALEENIRENRLG